MARKKKTELIEEPKVETIEEPKVETNEESKPSNEPKRNLEDALKNYKRKLRKL